MKVYPLAIDNGFGAGAIDYLDDDITAMLVSDLYAYADDHEFLEAVAAGARLSTVLLTGKTITDGEFAADDLTAGDAFQDVPIGDTATGIIIYQDTGSDATSRLISWHDRTGDTVPISVETDDADITATWPLGRIFRL